MRCRDLTLNSLASKNVGVLRKLASQTAIYGLSSIVGRFLNYLLVPLYTYSFVPAQYGVVAEFYAYIGFFAVLLVFGLETGYFRFRNKAPEPDDGRAYATAFRFLIAANVTFFLAIWLVHGELAALALYPDHPEYVLWMAGILVLDSLGALPFARLRAEERAWRFAGIKLTEILLTVVLNLLFIVWLPKMHGADPNAWWASFYDPAVGVGYVFIANLIASGVKLVLLLPQFRGVWRGFDVALLKRMLKYSLPMVIIGFAGIVNEMLDRALLKYLLPYDLKTNLHLLGTYGACYKLSLLMSLFIQAFRYAAEPFFFAYAAQQDAKRTYADVLKYFVMFCVFIFLFVMLYLDLFKYFIGPEYRDGLPVVPILLMANLCLGIYVNLSIWYKLTDRTMLGAWVALGGAVVTIVLNVWWIPIYGYMGSAWATLAAYGGMAIASYLLGRRYYPVEYDLKKILGYTAFGLALYFAHVALSAMIPWPAWITGTLLLFFYLTVAWLFDGRALLSARTARR